MVPTPTDRRDVVLIESAKSCVSKLEALKKLAIDSKSGHFTGETKTILAEVVSHADNNIVSLKNWRAAVSKGQQTSDTQVVQTVNKYFEQLQNHIIKAESALDHRLRLRIYLNFALSSQKQKASAQVRGTLQEIERTVGQLQSQVSTVVVDTLDQQNRTSRIDEVVHRRTKSYAKFQKALRSMSTPDMQSSAFGVLPILWQELPSKPELAGMVHSPFVRGDGIVYTPAEFVKAENVLKDYYDAWSEVVVRSNRGSSDRLPKVRSLTNMAKICLVLKGMERPGLLDHFCRSQKADIELALPIHVLEDLFQADKYYAGIFATEQYRVVRRTWNEGDHIEIPKEEPLPLLFLHEYTSGGFGTVQSYKDVHTHEVFARKEQITTDARDHLLREKARLQKVQHRHIVQYVKSYQRGNELGLLLKPAADTDLQKLFTHFHAHRGLPDERKLRSEILTAFGCLSHGLSHIHGRRIRHKDIKPNNILYQVTKPPHDTVRFLWADFGLAHDFGKSANSLTFNSSEYSPQYAAPENAEDNQAALDAKAAGLDGLHTNQDTDDEHEDSSDVDSFPKGTERPKRPGHGRKADVFSYGCVFLDILSVLLNLKIPESDTPEFAFRKHITKLQGWAEKQAALLEPEDPLRVPFHLAIKMIRFRAQKRPRVAQIVSVLASSSAAEKFFCNACLPEAKVDSATWLVQRQARRASNGAKTSEESASGTSGTSCFESEGEELRPPLQAVQSARFLSPATAAAPRSPLRQANGQASQNGQGTSKAKPQG